MGAVVRAKGQDFFKQQKQPLRHFLAKMPPPLAQGRQQVTIRLNI
jgi:hypothetical protein